MKKRLTPGHSISLVVATVIGLLMVPAPALANSPSQTESPTIQELRAEAGSADLSVYLAYPHCTGYVNVPLKAVPSEFGQIPSSAGNYNCILESGNNNQGVWRLQNHMNNCYGKSLTRDGAFGPATYNALLSVQATIGATVDGVYGPNTRSKMKFFASNLSCNFITAYQGF